MQPLVMGPNAINGGPLRDTLMPLYTAFYSAFIDFHTVTIEVYSVASVVGLEQDLDYICTCMYESQHFPVVHLWNSNIEHI